MHLYLTWWRWLRESLAGAETLVVNMDETSVQHEYSAKRGFVCNLASETANSAHGFFLPMTAAATRAHTTLVAMITPDSAMQPYLPQILIPNHRKTTKAEYEVYDKLGAPIVTWHECNGWVDQHLMCDILTLLRREVRKVRAGCQIIFLMDGASQHVSEKVLQHAARLQIVLILIPAQCTWLLQPLDVEVFLLFKEDLRNRQVQERLEEEDAMISAPARIRILSETIRRVLVEASHSKAFARTALPANVEGVPVRSSIQKYMPSEPIEARALTPAELTILIGRNRQKEVYGKFFNRPSKIMRELEQMSGAEPSLHAAVLEAHEEVFSGEVHVSQRIPPSPPPMPPPGEPPSSQVSASQASLPGPIAHFTRAQVRARRHAAESASQH